MCTWEFILSQSLDLLEHFSYGWHCHVFTSLPLHNNKEISIVLKTLAAEFLFKQGVDIIQTGFNCALTFVRSIVYN